MKKRQNTGECQQIQTPKIFNKMERILVIRYDLTEVLLGFSLERNFEILQFQKNFLIVTWQVQTQSENLVTSRTSNHDYIQGIFYPKVCFRKENQQRNDFKGNLSDNVYKLSKKNAILKENHILNNRRKLFSFLRWFIRSLNFRE